MSLEECFDCCVENKYDSKKCNCDCTIFCEKDCEKERFEAEEKYPALEEEEYFEEDEEFEEDEPLCEEGQELYDSDCDPCAPEGEEFPC